MVRDGLGLSRVVPVWVGERGILSLKEIRGGISHGKGADPEAFERANYITALENFSSEYLR